MGRASSPLLRYAILPLGLIGLAAGGWILFEQRPGAAEDRFERDVAQRMTAAKPKRANAETFRATVCAASPCVLVEAGGLAFLVGAGAGAADGLLSRGLFRTDLDAVLLSDLSLASIEGLAGLQRASFELGRQTPFAVYGPEGLLAVADGVSLMLASGGEQSARVQVAEEQEDQGLAGRVVFDSGVVTIRAFRDNQDGRVYRFDVGEKSLIVAGCGAAPSDVLAAARGATIAAGIVAAESKGLSELEAKAARAAGVTNPTGPACMEAGSAAQAIEDARLAGALLAPLAPAPRNRVGREAWMEAIPLSEKLNLAPGFAGAVLDMTGAAPVLKVQ